MSVNEAIKSKINKILYERNLTVNKLSLMSGIMQSTLDSILNGRSNNPTIKTIAKICNGLGITLYDFFNDELFNSVDIEK